MRKQLKLLLLVATVVALFAMAMIVGSAAFEVDGTEYATFAEAYDAVDADGTIKLTSDVTLDAKFTLTKGFTIDGANPAGGKFKITSTYSDALTFGAKINVNIKNADVVVSADRLAACGSSYRGSELAFDNCTVTCEVTRISRGTGLIMSFNNCIDEIPKDSNIGSVTITREYLEKRGGPRIEMRGAMLPELSS